MKLPTTLVIAKAHQTCMQYSACTHVYARIHLLALWPHSILHHTCTSWPLHTATRKPGRLSSDAEDINPTELITKIIVSGLVAQV